MSTLGWSQGLVVSTRPIYLIAKEITKGVEEPQLLLQGQSGHDVQLTPAHRKAINDASLVIWLGKAHEAPLNKLLSNNKKAIALLDSGILSILPQRNTRGAAFTKYCGYACLVRTKQCSTYWLLLQLYDHNSILKTKRSIGIMRIHLHEICCRRLKLTIAQATVNRIGLIMMLINI